MQLVVLSHGAAQAAVGVHSILTKLIKWLLLLDYRAVEDEEKSLVE